MADAGSNLSRSRVHRALSRPNLLMGADRELVLLEAELREAAEPGAADGLPEPPPPHY